LEQHNQLEPTPISAAVAKAEDDRYCDTIMYLTLISGWDYDLQAAGIRGCKEGTSSRGVLVKKEGSSCLQSQRPTMVDGMSYFTIK